jgi:hypothetical protein
MLNVQQKEILKTELQKPEYAEFGQGYPAIRDHLNAVPMIANPTTQGRIQKPYSRQEILSLLTDDEAIALYPGITDDFQEWLKSVLPSIQDKSSIRIVLGYLASNPLQDKSFMGGVEKIILSQNKALVIAFSGLLKVAGLLSSATSQKIVDYVNSTIPDPGYQSQIQGESIAQSLGIAGVDEFDIQEVLN